MKKKQKFQVDGMHCAACQAHVQKAVSALDGVSKAEVNLLNKDMTVDYDDSILTESDIVSAVRSIGFTAEAAAEDPQESERQMLLETKRETTELLLRIVLSLIFLLPLSWISMGDMLGLPQPEQFARHPLLQALAQLLLLAPILFLNRAYFINGFRRLCKLMPDMDSLIAIGAGAGIVYSLFTTLRILFSSSHELCHELYFESAGMILVLITIGKFLEAKSRSRTGNAIEKLIALTPKTAAVLRDGKEEEIAVSAIVAGDTVLLRSGSSVPADGVVLDGRAALDQSAVTGESVPVEKTKGNRIISGSICRDGFLKYRAEKVGAETTLAQVIALVKEAAGSKAPISRLADRVSAVFVPAVIAVSLCTFTVWLVIGGGFGHAVEAAIAVLVISCPCAIGLATPVAIMAGTGRAAELGILFKNAEALENLHKVDCVVFDKTGTLTAGTPSVTAILPAEGETGDSLLALAAGAEHFSGHPFAKAICKCAEEKKLTGTGAHNFTAVPGKGIHAVADDGTVIGGGNQSFLREMNHPGAETAAQIPGDRTGTPLFFIRGDRLAGVIVLEDTVRKGAAEAVLELKKRGIRTIMLTGDNRRTAEAAARQTGVDEVEADVLPADKEAVIRRLQQEGRRVAMAGDGVNDAPALARADIGIAVGNGTEIALDAADVVLARSNPGAVVLALELSRAVTRNIKMNLFWAFIYHIIGIPLAAGVFYNLLGWQLSPMFGAAAMSLSSFCVVSNALRLRKFGRKRAPKKD